MFIYAIMNVFNVLLQIIFVHDFLVTDRAARGMVILDMVRKDVTVCEILVAQWTLKVVVV